MQARRQVSKRLQLIERAVKARVLLWAIGAFDMVFFFVVEFLQFIGGEMLFLVQQHNLLGML